ncbi:hypothetical protein, partial [Serratia fonticola]
WRKSGGLRKGLTVRTETVYWDMVTPLSVFASCLNNQQRNFGQPHVTNATEPRDAPEMKYVFIEKHQAEFSIKALCRVLRVVRSGWYA